MFSCIFCFVLCCFYYKQMEKYNNYVCTGLGNSIP